MKNIPIKFRGRCWLKGLDPSDIKTTLNDGDYVYGGYARIKFFFEDDEGDFIIDNNCTVFLVYPDSVVQLVGYDIDGKEVYEGDKLFVPEQNAVAKVFVDRCYGYYDDNEFFFTDFLNSDNVRYFKLRLIKEDD